MIRVFHMLRTLSIFFTQSKTSRSRKKNYENQMNGSHALTRISILERRHFSPLKKFIAFPAQNLSFVLPRTHTRKQCQKQGFLSSVSIVRLQQAKVRRGHEDTKLFSRKENKENTAICLDEKKNIFDGRRKRILSVCIWMNARVVCV